MANEKATVTATYKLDKDSKVKAIYCQNTDNASVEYINTTLAGEHSEVKARVDSGKLSAQKISPKVSLTVERTFDI